MQMSKLFTISTLAGAALLTAGTAGAAVMAGLDEKVVAKAEMGQRYAQSLGSPPIFLV
jgi:hypothetical protein